MGFVVQATWTALPGHEREVRAALLELAARTREEPGNILYIPYEHPDDPARLGIFELYADEHAFQAHVESSHFQELALGRVVPLLAGRERVEGRTMETRRS